jgi:hypothetical protein
MPVLDRVGHALDEMADVVQQRRHHQRIGRPRGLRKLSRLQAMLGQGDAFAEIGCASARAVQREDHPG